MVRSCGGTPFPRLVSAGGGAREGAHLDLSTGADSEVGAHMSSWLTGRTKTWPRRHSPRWV